MYPILMGITWAEHLFIVCLAGILIFCGWLQSQPNIRFFGTRTLRHVMMEVFLLGLVLLLPILLSSFWMGNRGNPLVMLVAVVVLCSAWVWLPFYAAVRLALPPQLLGVRAYLALYGKAMAGISLIIGVQLAVVTTLPKLLTSGYSVIDEKRIAFSGAIAVTVALMFLSWRALLDPVRFIFTRTYAFNQPIRASHSVARFYPAIGIGIMIATLFWIPVFMLSPNFDDLNSLIYTPPIYQNPELPNDPRLNDLSGQKILPSSPPFVLDIPIILAGIFSVSVLVIGSAITRMRPRQVAPLLLTLICLLYGLGTLIIHLRGIGAVTYPIYLIADALIAPVLIHFSLIFPYPEESLSTHQRFYLRSIIISLYLAFGIGALCKLFVFLSPSLAILVMAILDHPPLLPIVLSGLFWTWISHSLAWCLAATALFTIRIRVQKAMSSSPQIILPTNSWLALVNNPYNRSSQVVQKQLDTVWKGVVIAFLVYIVCTMLLIPFLSFELRNWAEFLVRPVLTLIMLGAIMLAVVQSDLWNLKQATLSTITQALVLLLVLSVGFAIDRLINQLEAIPDTVNWLSPFFIAPFFYLVFTSLNLEEKIQRRLRKRFLARFPWHNSLHQVIAQFKADQYQDREALIKRCVQATPPNVLASWLLLPNTARTEIRYEVLETSEMSSNDDFYAAELAKRLGTDHEALWCSLSSDLTQALKDSTYVDHVLSINDLQTKVRREEWEMLYDMGLGLFVSFGSSERLLGIFVAATDMAGDMYTDEDRALLQRWAEVISIWLQHFPSDQALSIKDVAHPESVSILTKDRIG